MSLIPIIQIDSSEARNLDVSIDLQKIYYQPVGYQRNAKKLFEASKKAGHDFTINDVKYWLKRQLIHLVHKHRPKYIPRVSFNTITIPNECHQADIVYMPYDKIGEITYLFCLNIVDVASRYKVSIPIGAKNVKDRKGILTSSTIARALKEKYDDPECPLVWPKKFLTDKGSEFKGECEKIMREHGVKILKAKTKRTMGILERYNRTMEERSFKPQDACELLTLHLSGVFREWVENLPIIVDDENNSITRLLGISPAEAIEMDQVFAKSSKPRKGPMGFDEEKLSYDVPVLYLLDLCDYEGGRRRATDMNWSPRVYHIRESFVQKNQPILYWLIDDEGNGPERSFVAEELQVIPPDTELPPQWVLSK